MPSCEKGWLMPSGLACKPSHRHRPWILPWTLACWGWNVKGGLEGLSKGMRANLLYYQSCANMTFQLIPPEKTSTILPFPHRAPSPSPGLSLWTMENRSAAEI